MTRVVVAMSGGVDSSVAAALLKQRGYEVIGVSMEVWGGESHSREVTCHSCYGPGEEEDREDARRVARILGIPFYTFDLRREYKAQVLSYFCKEYASGRTPNPCVRCNRRVKFDALLRKARETGVEYEYIGTGHYARVGYDGGKRRYLLKKAKDRRKDQSYFLFSLSQEQLGISLFPLGYYTKGEVRKLARALGLGIDDKPESQDFFSGDSSSILATSARPGPILNKQGKVLGTHRGIPFYTIGQRKGLGVSGAEPLYVIAIEAEENAIVVGTKEEVYGDQFVASELNWIAIERLQRPIEVKVKIRYRHSEAEAVVRPLDGDRIHVRLREPQMAITPGQAVVLYDDDVVLGGGTIELRAGRP